MNRNDFEPLRDMPDKVIRGTIRLVRKQATKPLLTADKIPLETTAGTTLLVNINYNPETGTKGINVTSVGEGPICRLDVDGTNHGDAGRSHKHSVRDEHSVRRNLAEGVVPRPELAGKSLREVFGDFCATASIKFEGELEYPDEV